MASDATRRTQRAAFSLVIPIAALLVFAPVFRAGNRPLPLLVLELLALLVFAVIILNRQSPFAALGRGERVACGLLVLLVVLPLIPVPAGVWAILPGRAVYAEAHALFGGTEGLRSISIVAFASQASALALLPPLAVFFGTILCTDRERSILVYVLLAIATLQAFLGLVQYGTQEAVLFLGMEPAPTAQGTYPNRNHFAGLFEMAFPLAAAQFAATFGKSARKERRYHSRGFRSMFAAMGEARVNLYLLYLALLALFGLAIVFSRSRTGIALLIVGIAICAIAFAPRLGGRRTMRTAGSVMVLLCGMSIAVGLVPVLQRFADTDLAVDDRLAMARAAIEGIGVFFPLGSGTGTFPQVFRRFHPADIAGFVNHAHNDYLEWIFEGGVLAAIVILLLLVLYVWRCVRVAREEGWPGERYQRIGAAIGILLIVLHGLVEYNLRIPANAVFFALLAGLLFAPAKGGGRVETTERKRERRPAPPTFVPAAEPPPADLSNPFLR